MGEKRNSQRIPIFLEIKEIDRQPQDDIYLLNFSENGAKIETFFEYTPGDQLEFVFSLPDKVTAISRKGQVIWISPHDPKPGSFLVGLELAAEWELGRIAPE
jgi:Tfp pilus assembly protein PilZ